jgi:PIN domain nuclease of toxin-antitoxin system
MGKYLLDTHIFIWWLSDVKELSKEVIEIISDSSNQIYVSSASIWEIAIKESLGKIKIDANLDNIIEENGFKELQISAKCANATKTLEPIHKDPFDRILISQAIKHNLILITKDKEILKYQRVNLLKVL